MGVIKPALVAIEEDVAFAFELSAFLLLIAQNVSNRVWFFAAEWAEFERFAHLAFSNPCAILSKSCETLRTRFATSDEFFGEACLTKQPRRMATAETIAECEIMRLEKQFLLRALHDKPEFAEMFITHIVARSSRVEQDLVDQLFYSGEKRLARTLLRLANYGKDSEPEPLILNIDQSTLANMIGTTRSRVNLFMSKFRKLGLIGYKGGPSSRNSYNGGITVNASLLNSVLDEQPASRIE